MNRTLLRVGVPAGLLAAVAMVGASASANADPGVADSDAQVTLSATPEAVTIAPLPCDRRGEVELSMTNAGSTSEFVDAVLTGSDPLDLSRGTWSTYLPAADPPQPVTAPLTVTAGGAPVGEHRVVMTAVGETLEVPVTVEEPPGTGPEDNLALYRQAFASTVHPNTTLCGGVDGDVDSEQWADSGVHDRTPGEFPDSFGVELDDTFSVGRVVVHTLDSTAYPAAEMGIRDFEVQLHSEGEWRTVGAVDDNESGKITVDFPRSPADQVRLVVHDSNDHQYSRVIELEVYQQ